MRIKLIVIMIVLISTALCVAGWKACSIAFKYLNELINV